MLERSRPPAKAGGASLARCNCNPLREACIAIMCLVLTVMTGVIDLTELCTEANIGRQQSDVSKDCPLHLHGALLGYPVSGSKTAKLAYVSRKLPAFFRALVADVALHDVYLSVGMLQIAAWAVYCTTRAVLVLARQRKFRGGCTPFCRVHQQLVRPAVSICFRCIPELVAIISASATGRTPSWHILLHPIKPFAHLFWTPCCLKVRPVHGRWGLVSELRRRELPKSSAGCQAGVSGPPQTPHAVVPCTLPCRCATQTSARTELMHAALTLPLTYYSCR